MNKQPFRHKRPESAGTGDTVTLKAEVGGKSKSIRQRFTPVKRFRWHHQIQALRRTQMDWLQRLIVQWHSNFCSTGSQFCSDFSLVGSQQAPSISLSSHPPTSEANWPIGIHWPIGSSLFYHSTDSDWGAGLKKQHHPLRSRSSKLYQFFTQLCMVSISSRTTWVAPPRTATGRTPTPAKAYQQCVQPVGINQILPPSSFCWGGIAKPLCLRPGTLHFIIIYLQCSSFYDCIQHPQPDQRCEHRSTGPRSEATLRCCSTASRYRDAAPCSGIPPTKLPRFHPWRIRCHIHGVNVARCNSFGCLKAEVGESNMLNLLVIN